VTMGSLRYPRDPSLDPQLVWKGKDEQDAADLVVDAPPVFDQERIDPRALIEELRADAGSGGPVAPYRHAGWRNRMILGDSLHVMASLAEREHLRGQVQMLYVDPPYGIRFGSNWQASTRSRDVRDGRPADASRQVEQIKAFRDTWELGIHSYLPYLRDRLVVGRDLLAESGSVFVQIGDDNLHLVRCLLDEVFGPENFIAVIPFRKKTMPLGAGFLEQMADFILWYARHRPAAKYRKLFRPVAGRPDNRFRHCELPDGTRRPLDRAELADPGRLPPGARLYRLKSLEPSGPMESGRFDYLFEGRRYPPPRNGYATSRDGMDRLALARRLQPAGNLLNYVLFLDDKGVADLTAPWNDTVGADDKTFVVQTSTEVVKRCMLLTTDPGDLVLDPTCGSGTTAYVAEQWGRRWITIDTSRVAVALARARLMGARLPAYLLADGDDVGKGFVYRRVPHVTLRSIANNPDIREGMTREQVDAAIARHADTVPLYDRPREDRRRVRVAGPFTVASLSPHRSLTFAPRQEPTGAGFEQAVLDNLLKAGVQNGRTAERLRFERLSPYPGRRIQAEGIRAAAAAGTPERVAVSIGPRYGTVGPRWVEDAAREALHGDGFDLLLVCGFAFEAEAPERVGGLPVLAVRMSPDLAMGDGLLKKTGAGNLFTVFGEPDVAIEDTPDGLVVEVRGVDVFDPGSGEVRSSGPGEIAMWMVDTAYDQACFFVRHCYFSGGGTDPYARLKRTLRAEIDEAAWASLSSTRSRPFPRPPSGRIAVKVISHYGDEVLKVYEV
jgi:adenine-specific DNA-methyltransferase